jgi:ABC-type nitrate/sulfonate/bicarbonate transport system ATPase subunit
MRQATSAPMPAVTATGSIAAHGISQTFRGDDGRPVVALRDLSLSVAPGTFASIIGPSGGGKSTLLNILAGLDAPTAGDIWLDGTPTTPRERLGRVGLMPQRDLLLPWRSALGNAIAGLEVRGVPPSQARAQARDLFARFGLAQFERAYPYALSGGMRQRVALVRSALAAGPVLLLDEPFGALDALTRAELRQWLLGAWQALGKTIILVTHDVDEAVLLSDVVFVLTPRPGTLRGTVPVALPRPRDQADPAYASLRRQVLDLLGAQG